MTQLANPNSGATDFVRPGHVFPLVDKDGGVLMRSGHTEACLDLCRLSGLPPIGVIAELMNDDGTVMVRAQYSSAAVAITLAHFVSLRLQAAARAGGNYCQSGPQRRDKFRAARARATVARYLQNAPPRQYFFLQ